LDDTLYGGRRSAPSLPFGAIPAIRFRRGFIVFVLPGSRDFSKTQENSDLNRAEDASPDGFFSSLSDLQSQR
jgi:hypothetical protein